MTQPASIDWAAMERLRTAFLDGTAGRRDYWQSEGDLAGYDATFAQRIGWKWDYVFDRLQARGWEPPKLELLDWGCGSGIAARAFLDRFGRDAVPGVTFWDRSPLAMQFAASRARARYPELRVTTGLPATPALVLISHVLTELTSEQVEALIAWLGPAGAVLWTEPGTHEASSALIAIREQLRALFHVVAPCPHRERCGLLAPGNERHWCHHFAPSPPGVFTDPFWGRFARCAGVDLRSLSLSYLVLDKRPPAPLPAGAVRVIGRPRVYKTHAAILACAASGVREYELRKRELPAVFARVRKGRLNSLQVWERDGARIVRVGADANSDPPAPG